MNGGEILCHALPCSARPVSITPRCEIPGRIPPDVPGIRSGPPNRSHSQIGKSSREGNPRAAQPRARLGCRRPDAPSDPCNERRRRRPRRPGSLRPFFVGWSLHYSFDGLWLSIVPVWGPCSLGETGRAVAQRGPFSLAARSHSRGPQVEGGGCGPPLRAFLFFALGELRPPTRGML